MGQSSAARPPLRPPPLCTGGGVHGWDLYRKLVSRGANFIATLMLNPQVRGPAGRAARARSTAPPAAAPAPAAAGLGPHGQLPAVQENRAREHHPAGAAAARRGGLRAEEEEEEPCRPAAPPAAWGCRS